MSDLICILIVIGLIALSIFGLIYYKKNFKRPKLPCVYGITGAPKTGKTNLSVTLVVIAYRKVTFEYYFKFILYKLVYYITLKKYDLSVGLEKPMLYSNMPIAGVRYNELTLDIIYRRVRIPYKSVVLWDEVSLSIGAMDFKDEKTNNALKGFLKLFGHETHSGFLVWNTQSLADCHHQFRRCTGRYLYIYASSHPLNLFNVYEAIELINCEENQSGVNNVINGDIQKACYKMLYSAKYFKMYDLHYLSTLTDGLQVAVDYKKPILQKKKDSLKAKSILYLGENNPFYIMEDLN